MHALQHKVFDEMRSTANVIACRFPFKEGRQCYGRRAY